MHTIGTVIEVTVLMFSVLHAHIYFYYVNNTLLWPTDGQTRRSIRLLDTKLPCYFFFWPSTKSERGLNEIWAIYFQNQIIDPHSLMAHHIQFFFPFGLPYFVAVQFLDRREQANSSIDRQVVGD